MYISAKEIKHRIRSMASTKQITKAMEMVASTKFRRAQTQLQNARGYAEALRTVLNDISASSGDVSSYRQMQPAGKCMYIVIAGDRGLAGGYNSNVLKLAEAELRGKQAIVLPIGKKAVEFFRSHGTTIFTDQYQEADDIRYEDCFSLGNQLKIAFRSGEFDEIHLVYTHFNSALSQMPSTVRLMPLTGERASSDTLYEPNPEAVFNALISMYLGGVLYSALCESQVSEHAARRTAMEAATSNADEMISDLKLQFNRARQASITQEIAEIISGSQ